MGRTERVRGRHGNKEEELDDDEKEEESKEIKER